MPILDWIPFASGVKILAHHPEGLFAVEKPAGVLAHPNSSDKKEKETVLITGNYSMEEEAFHIRDGKGGIKKVFLLNRLDSPTSGVLLLSTNEALAEAVKVLFAESKVSKKYVAIVKGRGLRSPRGTWQDSLDQNRAVQVEEFVPVLKLQVARLLLLSINGCELLKTIYLYRYCSSSHVRVALINYVFRQPNTDILFSVIVPMAISILIKQWVPLVALSVCFFMLNPPSLLLIGRAKN
jgi:hypothetical protein